MCYRFSWDWTISPTKFNHFYAGGNNWRQDHKSLQEYIGNWKSKFCLGNVPNCNENLVNLFSGGNGDTYSTWGGQADNGSENTVYSYNDDFTWIKGAHTFKFGGSCQINHYNGFGRQCEAGCAGFSYTETGRSRGNGSQLRAAMPSHPFCWAMPIQDRSTRLASSASSSPISPDLPKMIGM